MKRVAGVLLSAGLSLVAPSVLAQTAPNGWTLVDCLMRDESICVYNKFVKRVGDVATVLVKTPDLHDQTLKFESNCKTWQEKVSADSDWNDVLPRSTGASQLEFACNQ